MRTDIPCACLGCNIVYANARALLEEGDEFLRTADPQAWPSTFEGKPCKVCGIEGKRVYRLLVGPLHIMREGE